MAPGTKADRLNNPHLPGVSVRGAAIKIVGAAKAVPENRHGHGQKKRRLPQKQTPFDRFPKNVFYARSAG
jgi:hypothetical protein